MFQVKVELVIDSVTALGSQVIYMYSPISQVSGAVYVFSDYENVGGEISLNWTHLAGSFDSINSIQVTEIAVTGLGELFFSILFHQMLFSNQVKKRFFKNPARNPASERIQFFIFLPGPRILPKNNGEKSVKSVKIIFLHR